MMYRCFFKVFKVKKDAEGNKRYKNREVLLGYLQTMGEDYDKYFSPVAKDSSTRIAFAITLYKDKWVCHSADTIPCMPCERFSSLLNQMSVLS